MKLNPQEIFNSSILKYRFDMSYIFKIKIWRNLNQMKFYLVKKQWRFNPTNICVSTVFDVMVRPDWSNTSTE